MHVVHVTTGLDIGGAEMVLYGLLRHTDRDNVRSVVISLRPPGPVAALIEALGIEVRSLGAVSLVQMVRELPRLAAMLRNEAPDVVQTWMYHADLIGGIAARLAGVPRVVWGLHAGTLPPIRVHPFARVGLRIMALLARIVPGRIVCCSQASRDVHVRESRYPGDKMVVIRNGFEVVEAVEGAKSSVHQELGIPIEFALVGRVGRWHPQKDYETLLRAWAMVIAERPTARLVLVGTGLSDDNKELMALLQETGVHHSTVLLGPRSDIARLNSAFDVAVSSSSYGEGLPIVLGEAMSVGTPVVTTDVADSRHLVGGSGLVIPPEAPDALTKAIVDLLAMRPEQRRALGEGGRVRVREHFSLERMSARYMKLYAEMGAQD